MKGLPLGRQHFEFFTSKNLVYVDKTPLIYELVKEGSVYFLSRPRRFGKSLTVDILKNIYLGNKHLFKEVWIYDKIEWKEHPVIHLDFSILDYEEIGLQEALSIKIREIAAQYEVSLNKKSLKGSFSELITKLSEKGKIAFLVDEYDKPITDHITDLKKANKNRKVLREFYSTLKGLGNHFAIIFITGIAKFAKVSLFSVLNHLTDLSMKKKYAALTGITQEELLENFEDYITLATKNLNMSREEVLKNVKKKYDGYSWDGKTFVYNPFSLINFFDESSFRNYWINTGTPKFLVDLIRSHRIRMEKMEMEQYDDSFFETFDIRTGVIPIKLLLFQTGYLTIQSRWLVGLTEYYQLDYPNEEVEKSFIQNLIQAYSFKEMTVVNKALVLLEIAIRKKNIKDFRTQLNVILSDISYHLFPFEKKKASQKRLQQEFLAWEGYFHTIIYLILQYLNIQVGVEMTKHKGRIDAVIEVPNFIYITEFKLEDAKIALQQIKQEKYAHSYYNSDKEVVLMGIAFDRKNREVKKIEWEVWERNTTL